MSHWAGTREPLGEPHTCSEEVSRRGDLQQCGRTAVALRRCPDGGHPYPVCAYHARGELVPLAEIPAALRGDGQT